MLVSLQIKGIDEKVKVHQVTHMTVQLTVLVASLVA